MILLDSKSASDLVSMLYINDIEIHEDPLKL